MQELIRHAAESTAAFFAEHGSVIGILAFTGAFLAGAVATRLGRHAAPRMLFGAIAPALSVLIICTLPSIAPGSEAS
jgi:hypothetical protein